MTASMAAVAVPARPSDIHVDFCLWDYPPLAVPDGLWRSETILLHSFALAGVLDQGRALMEAIRGTFGPFRTVWGIKEFDGRMSWELYFYDYDRLQRARSASRLLTALAPLHSSTLRVPEDRPYFMFSVSFTAADLKSGAPISELDVYIGNPGSTVSSGICYLLDTAALRLKNFYFFFDTETERAAAMQKLTTSAHFDAAQIWPAALAWPEMMGCKTVVVANKPDNDALYFSRVGVRALVWFLNRVGFDPDLTKAISRNSANFAHLYFDAGYDFRFSDGQPIIAKSSFYGYF
ncbi:MAG: hypothetical protein KDA50_11625 [Rhodobacteraceae bacterium]|nr:hypothetical protein [Paracoccaceae bacterium]